MRILLAFIGFYGLVFIGFYNVSSFAATDADRILEKVRDRYDGTDYVSNVTLVTHAKNNVVNEKKMYMLQKDIDEHEAIIMSVQYPTDVRDVGFLIKTYKEALNKEDGLWMFLPAFRKVRRIAPQDKRGAFMGSEFSYFDLDKLRVSDFESEIVKEETIMGRPSWKISRIPRNRDIINKSGYYKVVLWIDKERDIILQQDYYDAKGILFKRQKSSKVEKIQDIWTITQSTTDNFVEKKKSKIDYAETQYNLGLDTKLFRKTKLKRGIDHADVSWLTPIASN